MTDYTPAPYDELSEDDIYDLQVENNRLRERDAAAQSLIGLLRYHLGDHEAAGKDFRPYRDWKALDPVVVSHD